MGGGVNKNRKRQRGSEGELIFVECTLHFRNFRNSVHCHIITTATFIAGNHHPFRTWGRDTPKDGGHLPESRAPVDQDGIHSCLPDLNIVSAKKKWLTTACICREY